MHSVSYNMWKIHIYHEYHDMNVSILTYVNKYVSNILISFIIPYFHRFPWIWPLVVPRRIPWLNVVGHQVPAWPPGGVENLGYPSLEWKLTYPTLEKGKSYSQKVPTRGWDMLVLWMGNCC